MTILIVYIDDMIVMGNVDSDMTRLKKIFANKFELKDLVKLRYFLGIEVARSQT